MSIKLATNEKIIKQYNYATTREGLINKRITKNSVTVTNKRIIKTDVCDKNGYEKLSVSQINVKDITGICTKTCSNFNFLFLIFGILFGLWGLPTFFSSFSDGEFLFGPFLIGAILIAVSAFLIYKFIKSRKNVLLCDFIIANRTNSAMSLGAASYNSLFHRANTLGHAGFLKIVVDATVAKEFVSEIGAILMDIQNEVVEDAAE